MTNSPADDPSRPLSRREAREAAAAAEKQGNGAPQAPEAEIAPPARPAAQPVEPEWDPFAPVSAATPTVDSAPSALPQEETPAITRRSTRDQPAVSEETRAEAESLFPRRGEVAAFASTETASPAPAEEGAQDLTELFDTKLHKEKRKRGGCLTGLIIFALIAGGLTAGGIWAWNTYGTQIQAFFGKSEPRDLDYAANEATGEVLFTINEGDTGQMISTNLQLEGVTKHADAFYQYLIDHPPTPTFYPGTYKLQTKMTSAAAFQILKSEDNKIPGVMIGEGETLNRILQELADGTGVPLADFEAAAANPAQFGVTAPTLEGWLFPAVYDIMPGTSATDILKMLVDRTVQSLDKAGVPVDRRQEILTIASIVQREGRFDDFPKVATVIYNRLKPDNDETYGYLQMDSTVAYGVGKLHDGIVSTTEEDRANDNAWNTYKHPGLPAGPISNMSEAAIDAAMHPAEGDWLYFVTVNLDTGETIFSNNYEDQLKYEAQWHQWCEDNPDSGC